MNKKKLLAKSIVSLDAAFPQLGEQDIFTKFHGIYAYGTEDQARIMDALSTVVRRRRLKTSDTAIGFLATASSFLKAPPAGKKANPTALRLYAPSGVEISALRLAFNLTRLNEDPVLEQMARITIESMQNHPKEEIANCAQQLIILLDIPNDHYDPNKPGYGSAPVVKSAA